MLHNLGTQGGEMLLSWDIFITLVSNGKLLPGDGAVSPTFGDLLKVRCQVCNCFASSVLNIHACSSFVKYLKQLKPPSKYLGCLEGNKQILFQIIEVQDRYCMICTFIYTVPYACSTGNKLKQTKSEVQFLSPNSESSHSHFTAQIRQT